MRESFFIRVFFVLRWINCTLEPVQCQSPSGNQNASKSTRQMELCLRRCSQSFQDNEAEIPGEEVPVDHLCYAKCIGKEVLIGKLNSVVDNQEISFSEELTSSFKRIKREIPGSEKNDRDACLMNSPGTFMHPDTKVTFQEPKDSGSFMANVTWEPLLSDAFNWTGYRLIYAVGMVSEAIFKCVDLYKNETSYFISSGLPNDTRLRLSVVSIPFSSSHSNFTVSIDCHIPCHEKPTISGISTLNTAVVKSPSSGIVASPTKASPASPTSESSGLNAVLASTLLTVFMCGAAALLIFLYRHRLQKKASLRHTGSFTDIQFE